GLEGGWQSVPRVRRWDGGSKVIGRDAAQELLLSSLKSGSEFSVGFAPRAHRFDRWTIIGAAELEHSPPSRMGLGAVACGNEARLDAYLSTVSAPVLLTEDLLLRRAD